MKPIASHSKNRLFLLEFTIVLFFLFLTCTIILQVFALSHKNRTEAREWNHISEYVISVGEILEGTSKTKEELLSFYPYAKEHALGLLLSFDSDWEPVAEKEAFYTLYIEFPAKKELHLTFSRQETPIYQTTLAFPALSFEASTSKGRLP